MLIAPPAGEALAVPLSGNSFANICVSFWLFACCEHRLHLLSLQCFLGSVLDSFYLLKLLGEVFILSRIGLPGFKPPALSPLRNVHLWVMFLYLHYGNKNNRIVGAPGGGSSV